MIGLNGEVVGVRIGELAEATGTTARSLRHYEQAGLITSQRAANGYRVYEERTVVRVRNIRHLLAAGLTVDDVRLFLPCLDGDVAAAPHSERGLRIARERLAVLEARIATQIEARDRLATALQTLSGGPAPQDGATGPAMRSGLDAADDIGCGREAFLNGGGHARAREEEPEEGADQGVRDLQSAVAEEDHRENQQKQHQ